MYVFKAWGGIIIITLDLFVYFYTNMANNVIFIENMLVLHSFQFSKVWKL